MSGTAFIDVFALEMTKKLKSKDNIRLAHRPSWAPWITLTQPSGIPASLHNFINIMHAPGSLSDGFISMVLPQTNETGNICTKKNDHNRRHDRMINQFTQSGIIAGKLNGVMPAVTPKGTLVVIDAATGFWIGQAIEHHRASGSGKPQIVSQGKYSNRSVHVINDDSSNDSRNSDDHVIDEVQQGITMQINKSKCDH
uniref:Uncharacterized protein n=1 Tax=Romanomermis culicivorax TaxID=13658 RepID=A0A915KWX8_ROMCU